MSHHKVAWSKYIWNKDIPQTLSLMGWCLMHNKLPTYDNLSSRDFIFHPVVIFAFNNKKIPSICSFNVCLQLNVGTGLLGLLTSLRNFLPLRTFGRFVKRVGLLWLTSSYRPALSTSSTYWNSMNSTIFNNKFINLQSSTTLITSKLVLTGNSYNITYRGSMSDFIILKKFGINIHPVKYSTIIEVI